MKLREGAVLGVVEPFPTAHGPQFVQATLCENACCAKIEEPDTDESNIRLLDALGFILGTRATQPTLPNGPTSTTTVIFVDSVPPQRERTCLDLLGICENVQ